MVDSKTIRIDKFLWSVRIYKTRSIASEECRKGRIIINDIQVKPSRTVVKNEIITVKKPPDIFPYRVIEPIENHASAKLVDVLKYKNGLVIVPEGDHAGFRRLRQL